MTRREHNHVSRRSYVKLTGGAAASLSFSGLVNAESQRSVESGCIEDEKRSRVDEYLNERGLEAVWFAHPNSFAWLTNASNLIYRRTETGVAAVGYDGNEVTVVTTNNEAPRFREEVFGGEITVEAVDWYDASLGEAVSKFSPTPFAADFDVPGAEQADVSSLRQPLTESDIEAYRQLGADTSRAVESVFREIRPDDTEREVATALRCALSARGVTSTVVLVGGEERAQKHRHFTPTDATLDGYATASVVGGRKGLHASCTRTVAFDPPEWLRERHRLATRVEATALAATQEVSDVSGPAADVFSAVRAGYEAAGYPDEWQHHHQGGAAGFSAREWVATPTLETEVTTPMAYAWNPTIQGAKSEGTVAVTEDGFEPLTLTGNWPTIAAEAYGYDVTVERPGVLRRDC